MTRWLLIVFTAGLVVSVACFAAATSLDSGFYSVAAVHPPSPQTTRDMAWPGGESLSISVPAEITYVQGPAPRMTVTGPKDEVDELTLTDGRLALNDERPNSDWLFGRRRWRNAHLQVAITGPTTRRFDLSGAQKLDIEGYDQDSLDLAISGAAKVTAAGRAKGANLHVSGAGDLDLAKLDLDDATISISGAGKATLRPTSSADVSISGVGRVDLLTHPKSLRSHISGAGSITQP